MAVERKVKEKNNKSGLASITGLLRGFKAEAKRITWPTKKEIKKASITVFVLCGIYMAYVVAIDAGFEYVFNLILGIK